jgi:hypothetical protein
MRSKAHRCQECKAVSYAGRPGMYASDCIPHALTCSQYPSAGQRQQAADVEFERRKQLAASTAEGLAALGYQTARASGGLVTLDADDAAALLEYVRK